MTVGDRIQEPIKFDIFRFGGKATRCCNAFVSALPDCHCCCWTEVIIVCKSISILIPRRYQASSPGSQWSPKTRTQARLGATWACLARWLTGGGWYNGQGAGDGSNGNVCGMSAIYPLNWGLLGGWYERTCSMDKVVNIDVGADIVRLLLKRVSRIQLTNDNGSCL